MKLVYHGIARILAAGMLVAFAGNAAAQQTYPHKPIRFICPFPPGGSTTAMARLLGQKMAESWGQPVIVDNRPGGDSVIGTQAAAKAPPDGYTILVASPKSLVINSLLLRNLSYDLFRDLAPVANLVSTEFALVLNPSVPANTLQEFIALAKAKPGQLNYGAAGGIAHIAVELFLMTAGIQMQYVPYKGGAQVVTDLLGGQIQAAVQPPIFASSQIRLGKLKALAITGERRFSELPTVPTFREAGLPAFDEKALFAVFAPAGTPPAIIKKLSIEIGRILALPDSREKMASQGLDPSYSTPEQLAELMKKDVAKFAKVIKAANITIAQ